MPAHLSSLAAAYRGEKDNQQQRHHHPSTQQPHHHRDRRSAAMAIAAAEQSHHERVNPFLPSSKHSSLPSHHPHFGGLDLPPPFAGASDLAPRTPRSPSHPIHRGDRQSSSTNKASTGSHHHRHHHRSLKSPPTQDPSSLKAAMMGVTPHLHSSHHHPVLPHQRPHHSELNASLESTKDRLSRYPAHIELDRAVASASYQRPLFLDLQDRSSRSAAGAGGMYPPPEMLSRHSEKARAPRLSPRGAAAASLLRTIDHAPQPGVSPYDKGPYIDMDKAGRVLPPHSASRRDSSNSSRHHFEQLSVAAERSGLASAYAPLPPFGVQPRAPSSSSGAALLSAYNMYGGAGGSSHH